MRDSQIKNGQNHEKRINFGYAIKGLANIYELSVITGGKSILEFKGPFG